MWLWVKTNVTIFGVGEFTSQFRTYVGEFTIQFRTYFSG